MVRRCFFTRRVYTQLCWWPLLRGGPVWQRFGCLGGVRLLVLPARDRATRRGMGHVGCNSAFLLALHLPSCFGVPLLFWSHM